MIDLLTCQFNKRQNDLVSLSWLLKLTQLLHLLGSYIYPSAERNWTLAVHKQAAWGSRAQGQRKPPECPVSLSGVDLMGIHNDFLNKFSFVSLFGSYVFL